ncbi:MAG: TIGR02117 family protein [Parasphingorhabdus sp.]|uniref:TIGR02117 family protein n=1 Tax=Parasphingorhabdus sp. TaxID=2709688 RepID=UPI0032968A3E
MKWPKHIARGLGAGIFIYLTAALFGSILPANQFWKSPDDGIELFVETNGLHTGIIMPMRSDVHDWSAIIRPDHLENPGNYGSHIMVGWGHEGVYRNAEHWQDLRVRDAASAVFGSNAVLLHVYHLNYPQTYPHYRRSFKVSEAEYRAIALAIQEYFARDNSGQVIPSPGYGQRDVFYRSQGHYNAFFTCNSWTSKILRGAGIRTGIWTPFQGGVMRWFPETDG